MVRCKQRKSKRGGSLRSWLKKAHSFARRHKLASRLIHHGTKSLPKYLQPLGTQARNYIARRGYGVRVGGTFRLAGSGKRRVRGGRVY